jgi:hypothetical protein
MTDQADDTIRCTPRSSTAEFRPAFFHGRQAVVSITALALPPALVGYLVLVDFNKFVAFGVLISLFWVYLVVFALPFDQAKAARPVEWTLAGTSVTLASPGATGTVDWTHFGCLVVGRRALILHVRKGGPCLVLPLRCLTSEELGRLIGWTRAQGLTARRTRLRLWPAPALTGTLAERPGEIAVGLERPGSATGDPAAEPRP